MALKPEKTHVNGGSFFMKRTEYLITRQQRRQRYIATIMRAYGLTEFIVTQAGRKDQFIWAHDKEEAEYIFAGTIRPYTLREVRSKVEAMAL